MTFQIFKVCEEISASSGQNESGKQFQEKIYVLGS